MIRIATVPYCNAWPLTHFLSEEMEDATLTPCIPSAMRNLFQTEQCDLAMMPVAEMLTLPHATIVSDCAIACFAQVQSVRILSRVPIERIETISLDTASRSSVTVAEILFRHFYRFSPQKFDLNPTKPLHETETDAFLVIGDRALAYRPSERFGFDYDVGELWLTQTGLPLVFAAWIAISDAVIQRPNLVSALERARNRGVRAITQILNDKEKAGVPFPMPREDMVKYLSQRIVYQLDDAARRSMKLFFDLAKKYGLPATND